MKGFPLNQKTKHCEKENLFDFVQNKSLLECAKKNRLNFEPKPKWYDEWRGRSDKNSHPGLGQVLFALLAVPKFEFLGK
jgi:hypothetical protein